MSILSSPRICRSLFGLGVAAGALLMLSACSSSHPSSSSSTSPTSAGSPSSPGVTVATADVAGYGTILVDGRGRTLYMLTADKGGRVTCTAGNGCSTYWFPTQLPAGVTAATAGSGTRAGLFGTAKDATGQLQVTYAGWPLYTYSGDSASGQAHGQGIASFGGTWYVMSAAGQPVTSAAQGQPSTSTTKSTSSGGGY